MNTQHSSSDQPSAALSIEELFNFQRKPAGLLKTVSFCLYAPFGLLICLLRLFLGFHAFVVSCVLPQSPFRRYVLRFLCGILGLVVVEEGRQDEGVRVVVANHLSPIDHTAIQLVRPCVLPSVWDLPELLMWCFGYADLGLRQGRQVFIQKAKEFCATSEVPLLAFPEGAMTSGRRGLLRFSQWPFSLEQDVQPVVLSVSRPQFCDVSPTVLGSRWWTDLLWFLFVPYTRFKLRWLERQSPVESESAEALARAVQMRVAALAGVLPTNFSSHDVVEFAKRRLLDEQRVRPRHSPSSMQLDSMALKVKEMFPQTPLHVIRKDLERTGAVEVTASNIIEGRLPFTPEPLVPQKKLTDSDPSGWKTIFEQRKWAMIEENRRKYLEAQRTQLSS